MLDLINPSGRFQNNIEIQECINLKYLPLSSRNLTSLKRNRTIKQMFQGTNLKMKDGDLNQNISSSLTTETKSNIRNLKKPKHLINQTALDSFIFKQNDTGTSHRILEQNSREANMENDISLYQMVATSEPVLTRNTKLKNSWSTIFSKPSPPKCNIHSEHCTEFISKKRGPNYGRRFFLCSRPLGPDYDNWLRPRKEIDLKFRCGFFKWAKSI